MRRTCSIAAFRSSPIERDAGETELEGFQDLLSGGALDREDEGESETIAVGPVLRVEARARRCVQPVEAGAALFAPGVGAQGDEAHGEVGVRAQQGEARLVGGAVYRVREGRHHRIPVRKGAPARSLGRHPGRVLGDAGESRGERRLVEGIHVREGEWGRAHGR